MSNSTPTVPSMTFKKVSLKAKGKSSVKAFCALVAEKGIQVLKVIDLGDKKEKANITHIMGSNFLSVQIGDKKYSRIGNDLFCKAILSAGIESNIEVAEGIEEDLDLAFEGKLGSAYVRQEARLNKEKATS